MMLNNKNESITAIVVDDDIDTLGIFCEYLEICQFRIVGKAYNGERVLELYLKFKPDVIFLDVMMDGYDGIYALEQIRKVSHEVIIIMITADHSDKTAKKLEYLHATSVIYKPFDIKNAINMVKNLVELQKNKKFNLKQVESQMPYVESSFIEHTPEIWKMQK
jgi:DNA-binding response OmpR family regulator